MKRHHALLALMLALMLALPGLSLAAGEDSKTFEAYAREVQSLVARNWPLMDKVWPGADYTRHDLLLGLVNEEMAPQAAYLLSAKGMQKLAPDTYRDLVFPQPGGYAKLRFQGRDAVIMSTDDWSIRQPGDAEECYRTATHELVHFHYQHEQSLDQPSNRAQEYPVDPLPRLYRQMIYQRLTQAFEQPGQQADWLGRARYWLDKWHKEYPQEVKDIHTTDIAEGSARYIEHLGTVIADIAAGGDARSLKAKAFVTDEPFAAADGESYELGYVAGLLLDKLEPAWKQDFYQMNQTPVHRLLANVLPVADEADPQVKEQLYAVVDGINSEASVELKDINQALQDKGIAWLRIDTTDAVGSFQMSGNYWLKDDEVLTGLRTAYSAGGGRIALNGIAALFQLGDQDRSLMLIPLTMPHTLEGNRLSIQHPNLEVSGVLVSTEHSDGRTYYDVIADNKPTDDRP